MTVALNLSDQFVDDYRDLDKAFKSLRSNYDELLASQSDSPPVGLDVQAQLDELRQQLANAEKLLKSCRESVASLRERLRDRTGELRTARKEIRAAQSAAATQTKPDPELLAKLERLRSDNEALQVKLSLFPQDWEKNLLEFRSQEGTIEELNMERSQLVESLERLKKENFILRNRSD